MTSLTLARFNWRVLVRGLALACAAALIGLVCGRVAISHYGLPALEVLVAVPILILVIPRPYLACVLLLALLCTVPFYTWLPRANIPGHPPINVGDILLVLTVAATLWRRPARGWPPAVRRFYVALVAMLALALIPTIIVALHGHSPARDAIAGYKDLLYMTIGLTVALELSGRLWWPVVNGAIAVSAIVALLSILAAASGAFGHVLTNFDAAAVLDAAADTTVGTTSRIRLPGLFLVYAMMLPTLVMVLLIKDRWRWLRLVALALMVGAVAVSLNRNMYFGAAAGLLVTLLVGGPRLRHRFLIVGATVAAMIAIAVQSALAPSVTAEVAARAQSALSTSVLQSSSLTDRADEFSHALTSIAHHPLFGVGWFQNYGSYAGRVPRLGVEDWYLHVATDLGLPVAFAFLAIVGVLLSFGIRRARQAPDPVDRGLVAAGVGALTALLLSLIVGTYLQDPNTTAAFGFMCGFLVAAGVRAVPTPAPSATGEADHRSLAGRNGDCA